jgi:hypothetical protein
MGEVYKARDSKLIREVAVKVCLRRWRTTPNALLAVSVPVCVDRRRRNVCHRFRDCSLDSLA